MPAEPVPDDEDPEPDERSNCAVTFAFAPGENVHVTLAPEQSPDQPVNTEPASGAAVSVTGVPIITIAEHIVGQLMPEPDTDPPPVPDRETESVAGMNIVWANAAYPASKNTAHPMPPMICRCCTTIIF